MCGIPAERTALWKPALRSRILFPGFRLLGNTKCESLVRSNSDSKLCTVEFIGIVRLPAFDFAFTIRIAQLARSTCDHSRDNNSLRLIPVPNAKIMTGRKK